MTPKYQLNSQVNAYITVFNALITGKITSIAVVVDTTGELIFKYRVSYDNTYEYVEETDIFSTDATILIESLDVVVVDGNVRKEYFYE